MAKIKKICLLVFLSTFLSLITFHFCSFIAEKYFFDKFIYQKSITYGYRLGLIEKEAYQKFRPITNILFGQRIKNMTDLELNKTLFTDKQYNIAIIGDSYVWGTGIKTNQRFAQILEKKLNRIKPTKVITLGQPSDGILDYLYWYDLINTQKIKPNLFIFAMVENDAFIEPTSAHALIPKYKEIIDSCHQNNSNINIVNLKNIDIYKLTNEGFTRDQIDKIINDLHIKSLENPVNICIFQKSLNLLSNPQSIFFTTDNYINNSDGFNIMNKYFIASNKDTLSSEIGKNISKYSTYWTNSTDPANSFKISPAEGHPNALANQMYADILFNEITTNPKWDFNK